MTSFFSINYPQTDFELNGRPFQVVGLRVSNSLISGAETQELIDNMPVLSSYGINTYSVFFQGSRFGDVAGYNEDTTLNATYASRMSQIIEAADAYGAVVLVGCLYYGDSDWWWPTWGQAEANQAVANTVQWLADHQYYNVFIDVDNEHMSPFDDAQLIAAGKAVNPNYVMGASGYDFPANADVALHLNPIIPGVPYVESEGVPQTSDYWDWVGINRPSANNYIHVGEYTDEMKIDWLQHTTEMLNVGHGYMAASTWLQAAPPLGPNASPGGMGTSDNPGIRFWLEHVQQIVGAAAPEPPEPPGGNAVLSATLVDADTNLDILQLESGMTLDFSMLPIQNLSVRANTEPSSTGSVVFDFDGVTHIENILPYAIAGDFPQGDYTPWTPEAGSHSLVMTPYSGPVATGQPGAPLMIHFDILA
jgi:hypothetical protein